MTKKEKRHQLSVLKRTKDIYLWLIKEEHCSFTAEELIRKEIRAINKELQPLQVKV